MLSPIFFGSAETPPFMTGSFQDPDDKDKMLKNKHFSDAEWIDRVRGKALAPEAMDLHLAGCRRCRHARDLFGTVAEVARGEAAYEVPEGTLRSVRAIFDLQSPERVRILPQVLARLVYDSFAEPLLVGIRSRQRVTRQAMYRAGDYYVDLRMESEPETRRVSVVGQIANRRNPEHSVAHVPIVLTSDEEVVARAVSNEFGEFQLGYAPAKHLRLHVPVADSGNIEVALNRLRAGPPDASRKTPKHKTRKSPRPLKRRAP
jgi:hypothetical protein